MINLRFYDVFILGFRKATYIAIILGAILV